MDPTRIFWAYDFLVEGYLKTNTSRRTKTMFYCESTNTDAF